MGPVSRCVLVLILLATGGCATSNFDRDFASGRFDQAVRRFEADSTLWNEERPLFRAAAMHATPGATVYDPARAQAYLQRFLNLFPRSSRAEEARRLHALVSEILRLRDEAVHANSVADSIRTQLDSLRSTNATQAQQYEAELRRRDAQIQALQDELERLKAIDLKLPPPGRRAPGANTPETQR